MAAEAQTALQEPPSSEASVGGAAAKQSDEQSDAPETLAATAASGKENTKSGKEGSKSGKAASKSAKGTKGAAKGQAGSDSGKPSVAAHPRAARSVAQAKGWGGLAGFLIAGYFSLPTSTLAEAGLRALVAGSVCYVAAWAGAVFVWRRMVMIEVRGREQQLLADALSTRAVGEPAIPPGEPERAGGIPKGR
jgi:hypothetical protein